MILRPFRDGDEDAVDALLDPGGTALFANQFHPLHGLDEDGDRWSRTRLACTPDGEVVAAGTIARNRLHDGRYSLAVETSPEHLRHGIATRLVEELLGLRAEPKPLAAKVYDHDAPARGFARSLGFGTYQRCPGLVPDPCDPAIDAWARGVHAAASAPVVDVGDLTRGDLVDAFAEMYVWQHRAWSPVTSMTRMREVAESVVDECDLELGKAILRDGRPAAVAWVFREEDDECELVVETTREDEPGGVELVRALLAASLQALAGAGVRKVELDGHDDDPHLSVVVAELPDSCRREPLQLVELVAPSTPVAAM